MKKDSPNPDRPAVTIIVTTYDRARLVPRAIDSVLRQTYPNVDLVVVDDGSRDDTSEILAQYDDDPRVRIVRHDRNRGVTAAKNTGLSGLSDACTLFGMLDSDDTLSPAAVDIVAQSRGYGPVLVFAHIDGLTVTGNTQPLASGSLLSITGCTGVVSQ